jgi:nucleotide-binding universal stress UspA family protein
MVPQIKKILFTTNLSKESRLAFDYAISLAMQYGAKIIILHVMEETSWSSSAYVRNILGDERWQELKQTHEEQARQILIGKQKEGALIREALTEFCKEAEKDHKECELVMDEIVVTHGIVVDEIIHIAQERKCDLIVMGYHVRGRYGEAIHGSTTRRVLRSAKIPVMLVRLTETDS